VKERNKIILLISLILAWMIMVSCTNMPKPRIYHKNKQTNKLFTPYIHEYRALIGYQAFSDKFKELSINLTELPSNILGRCYWLANGGYEIEISKEWWQKRADPIDKQFTVFHELEHCIRNRMHTNVKPVESFESVLERIMYWGGLIDPLPPLEDGCPASVMHSHSLPKKCQYNHYLYYMMEIQDWKASE